MSTSRQKRRSAGLFDTPTPAFPRLTWTKMAYLTLREKAIFVLVLLVVSAATNISVFVGAAAVIPTVVLFASIRPASLDIERRVFEQGGPANGLVA